MKSFLFTLFACLMFAGIATAQCSHAKKSEAKTSCHSEKVSAEAIKAAENNDLIEQKTCEKSGKVSFVRTSVDPETGESSAIPVVFSAETKTFVQAENALSNPAQKGCCASKAKSKSCCAKKLKSSSSKSEREMPSEKDNPSKI